MTPENAGGTSPSAISTAWASPPGDAAHGPNGPRNVVYNCDVRGVRAGVWLGGMNCGWIFVGNRFDVGNGPAFDIRGNSREHHIARNVMSLRKTKTAVLLKTADCGGTHVVDNAIHAAGGAVAAGKAAPAVEKGNRILPPPAKGAKPPPRPKLKVPSIFDWQRKHRPLTGK